MIERALHASRKDLDRAEAVARIGSWRLDVSRNELSWSAETGRILGIPAGTPLTYEGFVATVHADDRERVGSSWKAALAGAPYDIEYRIAVDGETKWVRARSELDFDAAGKPLGGFGIVQDVTDKKQAEEQLLRQQLLTRLIADRAADAIFVTDETGCITFANPEAERTFGFGPEEMLGQELHGLLHHHYADGTAFPRDRCPMAIMQATGTMVRNHEDVFFRKDGSAVDVSCSYAPLEQEGRRSGAVLVVRDVSAQKAAQVALRESEERYRGIFDHAATGIAIADAEGRFQSCNPAFSAMLGYTAEELCELSLLDVMHPEERKGNLREMGRLLTREIASFETLNRCAGKGGAILWAHKHVSLLTDAAGKPTGIIVLVTDMTGHKRHEEQIKLLLAEVNHRSKNMLTVVQSIARQTAAIKPDDFIGRFGERIQALAASQDLLVKNKWKGVDLDELVHSQLAHFKELIGTRIKLAGPPLILSAQAAQAIGMALHELATNAGKYGALSNGDGGVEIAWNLKCGETGQDIFVMGWRERGGPAVTAPSKQGFGSTVISRTVVESLDANVEVDFAAKGLCWRLECPAVEVRGRQPIPA